MILKTIEHKLLSRPEINAKIPEETLEHFADLQVMLIQSVSLTDFKEKVEKSPYFSGLEGVQLVDFAHTAGKLKMTKSGSARLKYTDDLYVQIAKYDLQNIIDNTESESIKEEAKDMSLALDNIYSKIYKKGGTK